ncbi:DUF885 domain-containing protein [Jiangella gansuensis]|uniref:DUF885 domain-containing protein n=1 Tax=Jiangella gansuensis TaxID=281473 RepID=UPI0004ACC7DD|nr:DUF885 domain-containing protein [Jiangella gansuensis]
MTEPGSIARLADDYLETTSSANPFTASVFGVPGYDDRVPDLGEEAELAAGERLLDLAAQAEAIPADSLGDDDRVTRDVLIHSARSEAAPLVDRHLEFTVSGHAGPVAGVLATLAYTYLRTPQSERDYLSRMKGIRAYVEGIAVRASAGVASGRVPTRRGVEQTIERVHAYLTTPADADLMVAPATGTSVEDDVRALVTDSIRPAFSALLETLSGPVLAAARPDERSGLLHLPDGGQMYARAVAAHTTTARTPEELHRLGLDLCAQLREEFSELGQKVFRISDFDAIVDKLRSDPALRYASAEDIVADARAAVARAEAALPDWFGRLPSADCVVEPMNEVVAPAAVIGEYMPPADGRPGQYNVNTYQPHTRTRFEYETLSFHEGVPGHHLQFAVAQELTELPAFRRYLYIAAFGEGWGLYSERLADEMGLYSDDLFRFGMLSCDAWRACRLVVDTGLHHHGWTRQQAIDFMLANSAVSPPNVVNEVDRYIAWPGQALAYMTGRLEIDALRRAARERLGTAFDIRAFHDAVLGNGAVPLAVLSTEIHRWIAGQTRPPYPDERAQPASADRVPKVGH